jgi:hypothetical protein
MTQTGLKVEADCLGPPLTPGTERWGRRSPMVRLARSLNDERKRDGYGEALAA